MIAGLREFQDEKADVVARYLPEEAKRLQKEGEISANVDLSSLTEGHSQSNQDYADIAFANDDDSEDGEEAIGHRNVDFPQQPHANLPLSESESEEEEDEDDDELLQYTNQKMSNFVLDSD